LIGFYATVIERQAIQREARRRGISVSDLVKGAALRESLPQDPHPAQEEA